MRRWMGLVLAAVTLLGGGCGIPYELAESRRQMVDGGDAGTSGTGGTTTTGQGGNAGSGGTTTATGQGGTGGSGTGGTTTTSQGGSGGTGGMTTGTGGATGSGGHGGATTTGQGGNAGSGGTTTATGQGGTGGSGTGGTGGQGGTGGATTGQGGQDAGPPICQPGTGNCDGNDGNGCEAVFATDPSNCGACGVVCGVAKTCIAGNCVLDPCPVGKAECDGNLADFCETNTQTDAKNCGACGKICSASANATPFCVNSGCVSICNADFVDCNQQAGDGCEINVKNDLQNCGSCGNICPSMAHATTACVTGSCVNTCQNPYADCDKQAGNGCEADTQTDVQNCGTCGASCPAPPANATTVCTTGVCGTQCVPGYTDCNKQIGDGCEIHTAVDSLNCGACGTKCAAGSTCSGGACVPLCGSNPIPLDQVVVCWQLDPSQFWNDKYIGMEAQVTQPGQQGVTLAPVPGSMGLAKGQSWSLSKFGALPAGTKLDLRGAGYNDAQGASLYFYRCDQNVGGNAHCYGSYILYDHGVKKASYAYDPGTQQVTMQNCVQSAHAGFIAVTCTL